LIRSLKLPFLDSVSTVDDIALIAVVGEGMLNRPGIAARVFQAVSARGINILIISAGASRVATYFVVKRPHVKPALRAIHKEFFQ
jgi:aspartate kinase/aspartokinase/homoserine dehydrogenase 1